MNVVDALVVSIGIDASGLKQGAKEATSTVMKMSTDIAAAAGTGEKAQTVSINNIVKIYNNFAKEGRKTADETEKVHARMAKSTESVNLSTEKFFRTASALFLLLAGGNSLKNFALGMIGLDASVGRLATNTGQTTAVISGIGRAAERAGGSFEGATNGLKSLSDAYQDLRLTGNNAIMEPLAKLQGLSGRTIAFGRDVHANLLSIADAVQALDRKDPVMANHLARQILGDETLANMARGGSAGIRTAEATVPKITEKQAKDAADLQAQLVGVRQGFQDIGNSILMDFGPAMISGLKWVKDLVDANKDLIETKVKEWVKDVSDWFRDHKSDIDDFGGAMKDLVAAAGTVVKAFMSQSPMMQAFEAFAVLMGGRVLSSIGLVSSAMTALGALPAPAWLAAITAAAGVTTYHTAQRTARDMSDGSLNDPSVGVDPETGLTFHVAGGKYDANKPDETPAPASEGSKSGGIWGWIKKMYGFGGPDESRVKDDLATTAKSTAELRDLVKSGASLTGSINGVTASSGGLGGSGQHFGGGSSPGAALGDRGHGGLGGVSTFSKDMTPQARALLDTLASGEAPDYNVMNGGGRFNDYSRHPGGRAAGRYQFLPSTWAGIQKETGISDFKPESQDKGAWYLAQRDYRLHTGRNLDTDLKTNDPARIASIGRASHPTWVSTNDQFANRYGGFLAKQPGDRAQPNPQQPFADPTGMVSGDISTSATYNHGQLDSTKGLIFHHTGGRGTPEGVVQTLNQRGLGVQYVMDRDGKITRTLPEGARGAHILRSEINDLNNANTQGVEVIAKDDADVTPAQVAAGKSFAEAMAKRYPGLQVFGHGEVNPSHKMASEGHSIVEAYRAVAGKPQIDPNYKPAPVPLEQRTLQGYSGRDLPEHSQPVTVDHAVRHVLSALHHAQRLTHHNDNPVPVVLSDKSGKEMLYDRRAGAISSGIHHKLDKAFGPQHAAAYGAMMKMAESGRYATHATSNIDRSISSDTTINGGIHVHSAATDARGIAADIEPHLKRADRAGRADFGLG